MKTNSIRMIFGKASLVMLVLLFWGCIATVPNQTSSGATPPTPDHSIDDMTTAYPVELEATSSYPEPAPAPVPSAVVALPAPKAVPVRGGIGRVVVGEGDAQSNVYSHSYRVLNNLKEVKQLKNTITYVLLPDNISAQTNQESKKYKRYTQLLELIQELRKTDLSVATDSIAARSDNQFVLFSKDNKEKTVDVKNYNYELAHKVLDFFKQNYSYSLFAKEGPYLVTVTKDVWTNKESFTFLYVNMSSFNNSALKEVLESYKERLISKGNDEISMFEKLHATLLSFITNLNDDIHIFQSAFAGEL